MGIGFIITVIVFACLLGLFSRQVLTNQDDAGLSAKNHGDDNDHDTHHSNAI